MNFLVPVLFLAGLTLFGAAAWWLMTRRPMRWARWVDRENDFWRDRGWISPALAERMQRWEKGTAIKLLAAGTAIIGAIGLVITLVVLMKAISIQHHKLRMPFNPALQRKAARH
jgi:hypothetical protein